MFSHGSPPSVATSGLRAHRSSPSMLVEVPSTSTGTAQVASTAPSSGLPSTSGAMARGSIHPNRWPSATRCHTGSAPASTSTASACPPPVRCQVGEAALTCTVPSAKCRNGSPASPRTRASWPSSTASSSPGVWPGSSVTDTPGAGARSLIRRGVTNPSGGPARVSPDTVTSRSPTRSGMAQVSSTTGAVASRRCRDRRPWRRWSYQPQLVEALSATHRGLVGALGRRVAGTQPEGPVAGGPGGLRPRRRRRRPGRCAGTARRRRRGPRPPRRCRCPARAGPRGRARPAPSGRRPRARPR